MVPIKEIVSLPKPIKSNGVANIQPSIYKKGINIIVEKNFGFKKIIFKNVFFIFLRIIYILKYLSFKIL